MKFFRIITADITSRSKLRLPGKFVDRHGANMPGTVSLKVPTGAKWKVEVKKKEDGFWFGKGLFEFAESLGIKYGHFLMFDYDGVMHSVFHVVAIDMTAVEIQYPAPLTLSSIIDDEHPDGSASASKCPKSEKVEDDANANAGMRNRRSNGAPTPFRKYPGKTAKASSKLRRVGPVDEKVETDHTTVMRESFGKAIILNTKGRIQCVIQGRKCHQAASEKAIARAKAFKAEEPVCIIVLRPTYVWEKKSNNAVPSKCQLLFPQCFVKEYFNLNIRYATLRTEDEKTWSVEYRLVKHQQSFFTYGWKQFVVDNGLQSGDVCLFELIRGAENALKVVIFCSTDEDQAPK